LKNENDIFYAARIAYTIKTPVIELRLNPGKETRSFPGLRMLNAL